MPSRLVILVYKLVTSKDAKIAWSGRRRSRRMLIKWVLSHKYDGSFGTSG